LVVDEEVQAVGHPIEREDVEIGDVADPFDRAQVIR